LNAFLRPLAAVAFALLTLPAWGAEPADPAELFPPGTLAYAELHDPGSAAPQFAAAFKGTILEDSIPFIHNRKDKAKQPRELMSKDQLAILGLLASPEMAAEVKRFKGIGVGVVGLTELGDPDLAAAILTGDSAAAGLAARALITLSSARKIASVGDVPVYQFRQPAMGYDPNTGQQILQNDKPPTEGAHEATFAYLPGLVVMGTSKSAVAEVITRFQGKVKGSLAATPAFREAATTYRQPGVFFFANLPAICTQLDNARKKNATTAPAEPESLGWFKVLVNSKALRYVAGNAKLRDGGLALTVGGAFDPTQKSPLFDFLAGTGSKVELLRHAPAPATVALAVTFPEKDRAASVIGFLDALAKANGELGRLPSEAVKELEAKLKMSVAAGLIGKSKAVTIVLPVRQDLPKGAWPLPLLVLHTESPEVAAAWEDFLPKLLGDMSGAAPPQTSSETISGLKVLTLPAGNLPWKSAVHYVRKDSVFAIGLDRKLVVAAALGDASNTSSLSLPAGEAPVLIGSLGLGGLVRLLTEVKVPEGPVVPRGPPTPAKPQPQGFGRGFADDSQQAEPDPTNLPEKQKKEEARAWEAVLKALDGLPPTTLSARRAGTELRIDLWQPKVQGGIGPLVNAAVGWYDLVLNRSGNRTTAYPVPSFR
jgi:hypothetical protein